MISVEKQSRISPRLAGAVPKAASPFDGIVRQLLFNAGQNRGTIVAIASALRGERRTQAVAEIIDRLSYSVQSDRPVVAIDCGQSDAPGTTSTVLDRLAMRPLQVRPGLKFLGSIEALGAMAVANVDAHSVESSKRSALPISEGYRGYQPLLVAWAESGLVLADQFRDGNVPAAVGIKELGDEAYASLSVRTGGDPWQVSVRSDSATYEQGILDHWHRRHIRRAEQEGVELRWGASDVDVRPFFCLHLLTRRRLGVPIQPWHFFELLGRRLLARGFGLILSAHKGSMPVAAAVLLCWNGTLIYKFAASAARYWECRPNNLLFREAIRWAREQGERTFDWGRTDAADLGLRDFRRGWGAVEEPLEYSVLAATRPRPSGVRVRAAQGGPIRHSPPWVCRGLGELVYRYAA